MAWPGVVMGLGIALAVVGGLALIGGLAISIVGPDAVDDSGSDDGSSSILPFSQGDDDRSQDRNEVRAGGAIVMAAGASLVLVGGVLYAIARGVESTRRTAPPSP